MKQFFSSFQARLFACFLIVTALALLVPILYVRPVLHEAMLQASRERLRQESLMVSAIVGTERNMDDLVRLSEKLEQTEIRLSLLDAQGTVLFESSTETGELQENHADRPEIQEAMQTGSGSATRFSTTLRSELVYAALRLENGDILRLAIPFEGVQRRIDAQLTGLSLAAVAAVLISLLLAWFFSSRIRRSLAGMVRIVEGISLGKFSRRLHSLPGSEFQPMADAVNRMAESIEQSLHTVADQKNQLEAVLETMAEGVLVLGPKGRVRRVNRAFIDYFLHAGSVDVEGKQLMELVPSPSLQESAVALLDDPDGYGKTDMLQIHQNKAVYAVFLARPIREAAASLGLVAVFRDITELLRLESVRRDFVANVSHELRTPLTVIQGYAETLEGMDDMPEQGKKFAETIRKQGIALSALVDELLTLSRLESDSFCLDLSPVRPADALLRARQLLNADIERKGLRVTEHVPTNCLVRANSTLLERVFRNLLENACRYAPAGSEITVSVFTNETEALFAISDQGEGIPPSELGRIFERFYQVAKHRGARGGLGSGLGLAICKHIVERHHGRIWAESPSENAATSFFFTLPLAATALNGETA